MDSRDWVGLATPGNMGRGRGVRCLYTRVGRPPPPLFRPFGLVCHFYWGIRFSPFYGLLVCLYYMSLIYALAFISRKPISSASQYYTFLFMIHVLQMSSYRFWMRHKNGIWLACSMPDEAIKWHSYENTSHART